MNLEERQHMSFRWPSMDAFFPFGEAITTVVISDIPPAYTAQSFRTQLDEWGLTGTFDFYVGIADSPNSMSIGHAFINFIDPSFTILFYWVLQQCEFTGTASAAEIQGFANCVAHWDGISKAEESCASEPVLVSEPEPSQWAVNTANSILAPQSRIQFHKTKLCAFFKKNRCEMGLQCPFAHSLEELAPAPDLAKTKLCFNFFCGKCEEVQCKFAHGYQELRDSTQDMGNISSEAYCSPELPQWYDSEDAHNYWMMPTQYCEDMSGYCFPGQYVADETAHMPQDRSGAASEEEKDVLDRVFQAADSALGHETAFLPTSEPQRVMPTTWLTDWG
jgi:hypothetical protein